MAVLLVYASEMKTCPRCGESKSADEYARNSRNRDGLQSWCRECSRQARAAAKAANPDKFQKGGAYDYGPRVLTDAQKKERRERQRENYRARERALSPEEALERKSRRLVMRFGLSLEEFEQITKGQGDRCPLCGVEYGSDYMVRPVVDHDHACCPGRVSCGECIRGIICWGCNMVLGHIERRFPTPELLNNLSKYLSADTAAEVAAD